MAAHELRFFNWMYALDRTDEWFWRFRHLFRIIMPWHFSQLLHERQAFIGIFLRHGIYVQLQPCFRIGLYIDGIRYCVTGHKF